MLPDKIVYTDAGSFACAGLTVETYTRVVHKMWSSEEALKSSTYRELKAVFLTVFSLEEVFQNWLVKIYTDNQNVVRITNTGSMKLELQSMAIEIFNLCIRKNISLEVEWIPCEQNQTADAYSKVFDYDDWSITDKYFDFFNKLWGPFTCDVFADTMNHKKNSFFSPYWCPGSGEVDAFVFNWSDHNCWIVPPVRLICRAISHLALCRSFFPVTVYEYNVFP